MSAGSTSVPINLLLADVRRALFDEAKSDASAGASFRYEAGRAVGLMANAADTITFLLEALEGLLATHKQGRGQCCEAADKAIDAIAKARGAQS